MKKERIRKPDGRYLIFYSFDENELTPAKARWRAEVRPYSRPLKTAKKGKR